MDILYTNYSLDKIAWIENLDGLGTFGPERIIAQTNYPYRIVATDLDSDGDIDILAKLYNSSFDDRIVWYENTDGQGNFSSEIHITTRDFDGWTISTMDIDNDGDMDIVSSYPEEIFANAHKLVWHENTDGQGTFSEAQEIYQFEFLLSAWTRIVNIVPTDVNGDGKTDIIVETKNADVADYIYWFESIDELGTFSLPQFIMVREPSLSSLQSYDLDSDGDNDLLISFFGAATSISWFENTDGQGNFGPKRIISTQVDGASDARAVDFNGDGQIDVVSSSAFDDKIAWYENTDILDVTDYSLKKMVLYPNPTNGWITINIEATISKIEVYNVIGQMINAVRNTKEIDLSNANSGIYFLKIESENGYTEVHKVVKH